jgi:cytochrome c peroxidase
MMNSNSLIVSVALVGALASSGALAAEKAYVYQAGHPSLQEWLLPEHPPYPEDNRPTEARITLGKALFFDPRLSGDGSISCATCHNPAMGWSDGLPVGVGFKGVALGRASPTVFNTAYNSIQMWDGRKKTLEDQAMGPMEAVVEMNMDMGRLFAWLNSNAQYKALFEQAYPGQAIDSGSLSKAIAAYERTVISRDSPFDRWVVGDAKAMTPQQIDGFRLFTGKAACSVCHSAPNFTDNGFHNVGLASYGQPEPDMGRYAIRPISLMKGAFKTPTVREAARTAPYFHDGSAKTLMDVVEHYDRGGDVKTHLSPNMKALGLSQAEKEALVAFMHALSSPFMKVEIPELPVD